MTRLETIMEQSRVVGDCVEWSGMYDVRNKSCSAMDRDRKRFDIRRYLLNLNSIPSGHRPVWDTTCGHSRCIAKDHAILVGTEPHGFRASASGTSSR